MTTRKEITFAAACLIMALCMHVNATDFTGADSANDLLSNPGNWSLGLPVGQQGTVAIDAGWDSASDYSGYDVVHTGGTITPGGFETGGWGLGSGTTYLMDGGSIGSTRGITLGSGTSFTLDAGTANLTANNSDTRVNDASLTINDGTMQIGRNLLVYNSGSSLTINGGILDVAAQIRDNGFGTGNGTFNFNGGTTTASEFSFPQGGDTVTFGGSAAGSLSLSTGLGTVSPINWLSGSLMEFTVAGADQTFYEGLYTTGDLLFEGSNSGSFGTTFTVAGDTLSLIPEPSTFALLGFAGVVVFLARRRR